MKNLKNKLHTCLHKDIYVKVDQQINDQVYDRVWWRIKFIIDIWFFTEILDALKGKLDEQS